VSFSIVVTREGARAVLDEATGEVMHPVVGGRVEAEALYIAPSRLRERLSEPGEGPLVVLDVGLGAGSNAVAAITAARSVHGTGGGGRRLDLVSFDRTGDALALARGDAHAADFGFTAETASAARALLAHGHHETGELRWSFVRGELPDTLSTLPAASADLVFWDPFSPRSNPRLWSVAAFRAVRRVCRAGATLHTYGAATSTRAALLLAGFAVGAGDPSGKSVQTTVAAVDVADLRSPLDRRWLERWRRSSAPLPTDAPSDAAERIAAARQFGGGEAPG
jgi:queuine tRNA-ribosyltransferase